MNWLYLFMSGFLEIGFTTCMRFAKGWQDIGWFIGLLFCLVTSIGLVQLATRTIPLGTAYAIWTALGTAGTVVFGMVAFHEPVSVMRLVFIAGIMVCVIGLKVCGG
ncbi:MULTISPECIES: DMT family transporter [Acetobacter]|uniref:Guanidinium exporter n=2 Tax=Acetobacter persici TaxID=1076596 RepID=A0A1U9LDE5_9PROT|nr:MULTISPECIES: multidrug efflux SMR transporter [Acetobacter]AQT04451.1 cation transporter [Acetobacter persici]OUI91172.1 cation transporter [Acetobacter persici]GFE91947.1 QacE family quaternary ammonium compound efflux SMR transporter [Acetobacter persici]